jgi:(1->4)-alpha-D-glucan 1-alpha-D-glucosylmutase
LRALEPLLARPTANGAAALLAEWREGGVKLYVTAAALRFRTRHAALFADGSYLPLAVSGEAAPHVIAFARLGKQDESGEREAALTIAPRLLANMCGRGALPEAAAWRDTEVVLPPGLEGRAWQNVLTGEPHRGGSGLRIAQLLSSFPLALLE